MQQVIEFITEHFLIIWLALVVTILTIFLFAGKQALKPFSDLDQCDLLYSEKHASGYSPGRVFLLSGSASKVLHVMITDQELVIKTFLFFAFIAKKADLLHRIPLKNIISTEVKKGSTHSRLIVRFKKDNEEIKEIAIMSKNNSEIQQILERAK